jgi:hypothetical protein
MTFKARLKGSDSHEPSLLAQRQFERHALARARSSQAFYCWHTIGGILCTRSPVVRFCWKFKSAAKAPQCPALMHCNVICLVALDLVLRIVLARVMHVSPVGHLAHIYVYDGDPAQIKLGHYLRLPT